MTNQLQESTQKNSPSITKANDSYELSAYFGELTPIATAKTIKRLKSAFPDLPDAFHDVISERIFEIGFNDDRFRDAVNHVIDNCEYPTPTIAKFLSFDSRIKLLNYEQYVKKNEEMHGQASRFYKSVFIVGYDKPFWCHENDIRKFNLTLWKDRNQTR